MSILTRLSSQAGDRSEYSNRKVALECLDDPELLREIAQGFSSANPALIGDCAEVMTMVAEQNPDWIVPYDQPLFALLSHTTARVRWEAMHAAALIASRVPGRMAAHLSTFASAIRNDTSVIVRDHAVDALGNYARTGEEAAKAAFPLLVEALTLWDGKQAGHALKGLAEVAKVVPERHEDIRGLAQEYISSEKGVVRKAARDLLKIVG